MKTAKILTILALAVIFTSPNVGKAAPMGTAFTYQGHLYDANYPADGRYDFAFKLFSDPCAGGQVGDDVNAADVEVIDGYFTAELDFGSDAFDGDALWLELGVRPGDMNDPNVYTTLSPRQELTPAPYALSVRAPLELLEVTDEPVLGVVNAGQGHAIAAASGVKPAVGGICLVNGNYGGLGDVNGAVYGLAGADSNAGHFEGDVALHGDLVVADGNRIYFERNGTIRFDYDADTHVGNDRETYIGRNESRFINGDVQTTIGSEETRSVTFNRSTTVGRVGFLSYRQRLGCGGIRRCDNRSE